MIPRKRECRGCFIRDYWCELIGKPVPIERTQILLKSRREVSRPNRIDFRRRCIERHMVSENRLNAWRWGDIAKVRFAEFAEAPTNIGVFTAIADAMKLGGPDSAKHVVEFRLGPRLTFDVAVIPGVVGE